MITFLFCANCAENFAFRYCISVYTDVYYRCQRKEVKDMTKAQMIFKRTLGCIGSTQARFSDTKIDAVTLQTEGETVCKRTLNDIRKEADKYFTRRIKLEKSAKLEDAYRIMMNSIDQYEADMNEIKAIFNS